MSDPNPESSGAADYQPTPKEIADQEEVGRMIDALQKRIDEQAPIFERLYSKDPEAAERMLRQIARENPITIAVIGKMAGAAAFGRFIRKAADDIL
jgi:DNA-binding GntR family transcriptional regulator